MQKSTRLDCKQSVQHNSAAMQYTSFEMEYLKYKDRKLNMPQKLWNHYTLLLEAFFSVELMIMIPVVFLQ